MPNDNPIGSEYYEEIADYMRDTYAYIGTRYARQVPVVIWYAWSDMMHNAGVVDTAGQPKSPIYEAFLEIKDGSLFQNLPKN